MSEEKSSLIRFDAPLDMVRSWFRVAHILRPVNRKLARVYTIRRRSKIYAARLWGIHDETPVPGSWVSWFRVPASAWHFSYTRAERSFYHDARVPLALTWQDYSFEVEKARAIVRAGNEFQLRSKTRAVLVRLFGNFRRIEHPIQL